ncbi:hypothetical protein [Kitasatospora sp. NPDC056731]|uniref:hypothetical protein n=1 Tax=Kitasatospora sp. NPDC056731 TaxID=3155422 RepID=UPI00342757FE
MYPAGWPLVLSVLLGLGAQLATSAALSGPLGATGVWAGPAVGAAVQLGLLPLLARRGPRWPAPPAEQGGRALESVECSTPLARLWNSGGHGTDT